MATDSEVLNACSTVNPNLRAPSGDPPASRLEPVVAQEPAEAASAAVAEIAQRPNQDPATGRWLPGNEAALRHGLRRRPESALWELLGPAREELAARVRQDVLPGAEAAATLEGLADGYAEVRLLRESLFARMVQAGGPITAKGRMRPLLAAFLSCLDREQRLAGLLGLERRAKSLPDLATYLREREAEAESEAGS